jgi:hypothetical protein
MPGKFLDLFRDAIDRIAVENDPQALSGLCGAVCALTSQPLPMQTLSLIGDAGLAVCRHLPADIPDDSSRSLRRVVVMLLDQLDPRDPRVPEGDFLRFRKELGAAALRRCTELAADTEAHDFATALVSFALLGEPMLAGADYFAFFISLLPGDDPAVRGVALELLPTLIEQLIPRVPRTQGIAVDVVSPANYDSVEFEDRPFRAKSVHQPRFWPPAEFLDPDAIAKFFPDDLEERMEIHRLLLAKFGRGTHVVSELLGKLADAQLPGQEVFSKPHVLFWAAICRVLGLPFAEFLAEEITSMIGAVASQQCIAGEAFAGIVRSLKSRPWVEVETAALFLKPLVTQPFDTCEQFDSVW